MQYYINNSIIEIVTSNIFHKSPINVVLSQLTELDVMS